MIHNLVDKIKRFRRQKIIFHDFSHKLEIKGYNGHSRYSDQ